MKQALLITAYKDFEQLTEISNFFGDNFALFIHIDKKSTIETAQLKNIQSLKNVRLLSRKYRVNWGGRNHLKSILWLSREALKHSDLSYFHMITAQDFPIKSKNDFLTFFDSNKKNIFLENFTMPAKCFNHGGMHRVEYYNFYDVFDAKKHLKWINFFIKIQKRLGFKRTTSKKLPPLYAGSTYWSMHREALNYVINYSDTNHSLLKRLQHTFCAEEIYFQTVLMNSDFKNQIDSNNLRFIVWEERNGVIPAILEEQDLINIEKSDAFFARKFEKSISAILINLIKQKI